MSIDTERIGAVALITINRPEQRNALDTEHNLALDVALRAANSDADIRAVVITGAGETTFCSGADLKTLVPAFRAAVVEGQTPDWEFGGITADVGDFVPTIAAVNGHALAGGLELALACDIRLSSPQATFGMTETRWGIMPGAGGTQRLPRQVPLGYALEMLLAAEPVSSAEAFRVGLVNRVIPADELVSKALELAATIASRAPLAVRATRMAALAAMDSTLENGLRAEAEAFYRIQRTDDAREGTQSFVEKRQAEFTGK